MGRRIGECFQGSGIFRNRGRASHDPFPIDARGRTVRKEIEVEPKRGSEKAGNHPTSAERSASGENSEVQYRCAGEDAF